MHEDYATPIEESQHSSGPRSVKPNPTTRNTGYITAKAQMLGSHDRPTRMNTSAIAGKHPMSNVVYGFRPESGWSGVLFQVFLQGPFVANWQKEKELQFWVSFEGQTIASVFHEIDSEVSLAELGTKRYVLQCIVPEQFSRARCPVTLSVHGVGGKSIVQGLFMGYFHYRPDGIYSLQRFC